MKKLLLSMVVLSLLISSADARIWTDKEGRTVEGEFKGVVDGVVRLRLKSGKIAPVPLANLSVSDQSVINNLVNFKGLSPEAAVQVTSNEEVAGGGDRFSEKIRTNPNDPNAYYNRGLARTNQRRFDEAIADFDQAIALNPRHAAAYDGRGLAYAKMEKPVKAHEEFNKAIEIDPDLPSAYKHRGENFVALSKTDEGKKIMGNVEEKYRARYDRANKSNLRNTPWQPLNTTAGNVLPSANQMANVDIRYAVELEGIRRRGYGDYGGGGYGYGGGGVGYGGPGPGYGGPLYGQPGPNDPPLAVYPAVVTQGNTITLVANPAVLSLGMPQAIGANGKPTRSRTAYGYGRSRSRAANKQEIESVDFYRDVDKNGLLSPGDALLATDEDGSDGYSAVVSTSPFTPGNQTYFAVPKGEQPDPVELKGYADQLEAAAKAQTKIAALAKAGEYGTQVVADQKAKVGDVATEVADALKGLAPEACDCLKDAKNPITAVGNLLKSENGEAAAGKAEQAAASLQEAADKLREQAEGKGEGEGESNPALASANAGRAATGSGKVVPPKEAVAKAPGAPGKGGPGSDGDYGTDDDDDINITINKDDDDNDGDRDINITINDDDDDDLDINISDRDRIDRAISYVDDDDYDRAVVEYDHVLRDNPDDLFVLENRAGVNLARGGYEHAIRDYDHLIGLNTKRADLYYNRGCAQLAAGKLDAAVEDFTKSIALDETRNLAFTNRGTAFARKGDFKKAIIDFDQAISMKSDDRLAFHNRGLAYKMLGQLEKANLDFAAARELDGE